VLRVLALLVTIALSACGSRDANTWRFAIEETRGSVQDAYAQQFAKLIEAKSGGKIKVIVYPYGALGTSDQTTELLYNGSIQLVMASPGHLGKLIPEVQVFSLHYVFSGDDAVDNHALADPELRASFNELYREKNFVLLSMYTEGAMVWTTNKAIRKPSDFDGVKMRTMTSPILLADYEAYGASPTPLPYGEVYSALQLNMIDGQVNPIFAIQEMSFYEVTSYLIFAGQAQFVTSAMTNAEFYDRLEPEERGWIDDSIAELQPYIFGVQQKLNRDRLQKILADKPSLHVIHLTDAERAKFREASQSVHQGFASDVGPSGRRILDQLEAAVSRAAEAK